MNFEEKLNFIKNKWDANKIAIITDAKNNKYICAIDYNAPNKYFALSIVLHNSDLEYKGSINIFRDPNNRLFLSSIYIYWDSRGLGLASKLNSLANFVLRTEAGKIIRGRFAPYSSPQDLNIPTDLTCEEQEFFAEKFYKSNGYQIISYEDFKMNPEKYPELDKWDFKFDLEPAKKIIVSKIPKLESYYFIEKDKMITEVEPQDEFQK